MRTGTAFATCATVLLLAACSASTPRPRPVSSTSIAVVTPTIEPEQDLVVGGRHFHARCAGTGPSVMLVSGYGGTMEEAWDPVQATLGTLGRVCAYDRLGMGQSDPPPDRQTYEDMARDLDGVITALGLARPLVVVGHSMGGAVAATWGARHSADTRALVLLDPSPPGFNEALERMLPAPDLSDPQLTKFLRDVTAARDPRNNLESVSPEADPLYARLPRIAAPVHVLVRTVAGPPPPRMDPAAIEAAWLAGQRRLVALSTAGTLTLAERSGHFVAKDRPDLVVAAVRDALAR